MDSTREQHAIEVAKDDWTTTYRDVASWTREAEHLAETLNQLHIKIEVGKASLAGYENKLVGYGVDVAALRTSIDAHESVPKPLDPATILTDPYKKRPSKRRRIKHEQGSESEKHVECSALVPKQEEPSENSTDLLQYTKSPKASLPPTILDMTTPRLCDSIREFVESHDKKTERPSPESLEMWILWLRKFDRHLRPAKLVARVQAFINALQTEELPLDENEDDRTKKIEFLANASACMGTSLEKGIYYNVLTYNSRIFSLAEFEKAKSAYEARNGPKVDGRQQTSYMADALARKEHSIDSRYKVDQLTAKWQRYLRWGQAMVELVAVFGQAALFTTPFEQLAILSKKGKNDLSGIHVFARNWVIHRMQQHGFPHFFARLHAVVDQKAGYKYGLHGIIPPPGQDLDEWRADFNMQLQDLVSNVNERPKSSPLPEIDMGDVNEEDIMAAFPCIQKNTVTAEADHTFLVKVCHVNELRQAVSSPIAQDTIETIIRFYVPETEWAFIDASTLDESKNSNSIIHHHLQLGVRKFFAVLSFPHQVWHYACASIILNDDKTGEVTIWDSQNDEEVREDNIGAFLEQLIAWAPEELELGFLDGGGPKQEHLHDSAIHVCMRGIACMRENVLYSGDLDGGICQLLRKCMAKEFAVALDIEYDDHSDDNSDH